MASLGHNELTKQVSRLPFHLLWPSDAIWQHRTGSTLDQVMAWCRQATTNVDLSVRFSGIHLRAISYEIPQPPFNKISLKIIYLKLNWNIPGANELIHFISIHEITIQLHDLLGYKYIRFVNNICNCTADRIHNRVQSISFAQNLSTFIEKTNYTIRMFPPAIDIIPTLLVVVYSNGKYTN